MIGTEQRFRIQPELVASAWTSKSRGQTPDGGNGIADARKFERQPGSFRLHSNSRTAFRELETGLAGVAAAVIRRANCRQEAGYLNFAGKSISLLRLNIKNANGADRV